MNRIFLPAVKHIKTDPGIISFETPGSLQEKVQQQFQFWEKLKKRYFSLEIKSPYKPISTGERSQMNRIYGHVAWISFVRDQDMESTKLFFKHLATPGYPFDVIHDAKTERDIVAPWSLTRVSMAQANWLCKVIERWAGEEQIPLPEYAEDGSVVLL